MHAVPTGGLPYLDFMAPGILAQSVLFIAIFYGRFYYSGGSASNYGHHRWHVIPEGGNVMRIRIIFWSVPDIE